MIIKFIDRFELNYYLNQGWRLLDTRPKTLTGKTVKIGLIKLPKGVNQ